jgi:hypothetical protein
MLSVIHCPEQTGGHPAVLSKFERELGTKSTSVSESSNPFAVQSDTILFSNDKSLLVNEISRLKFMFSSFFHNGVIHLNNGRLITPYFGENIHPREEAYPIFTRKLIRFISRLLIGIESSMSSIRINQKCIFLTFQGSDARETQCFMEKHQKYGLADKVINRSGKTNDSIRRKKMLLAGIADKIYSLNPDLLEVLPKGSEFLPYATEAGLNSKILPFNQSNEFVVGHAPTHRIVKGTDEIIRVVQDLRSKGIKVRLELIEGLSREDAQKKYQEIDLFIDQLVIGWYGVVSLEVMALGKPVICFVKGKGLRFVPPQMLRDLPIINADEITLEEKIIEVMKMDTVQRGNLIERGIRFLQKWHDPRKIAQRVVADYKQVLSQRNLVRV